VAKALKSAHGKVETKKTGKVHKAMNTFKKALIVVEQAHKKVDVAKGKTEKKAAVAHLKKEIKKVKASTKALVKASGKDVKKSTKSKDKKPSGVKKAEKVSCPSPDG